MNHKSWPVKSNSGHAGPAYQETKYQVFKNGFGVGLSNPSQMSQFSVGIV